MSRIHDGLHMLTDYRLRGDRFSVPRHEAIADMLTTLMCLGRTSTGVNFNDCLAEARKQHAKEVREEALQPDRTPLTK